MWLLILVLLLLLWSLLLLCHKRIQCYIILLYILFNYFWCIVVDCINIYYNFYYVIEVGICSESHRQYVAESEFELRSFWLQNLSAQSRGGNAFEWLNQGNSESKITLLEIGNYFLLWREYKNHHQKTATSPSFSFQTQTHMNKQVPFLPTPSCRLRWPFIFLTKIWYLNGHRITSFSREAGKELKFNEEPWLV